MEEALSLMQKLGGVGFGTLLALILLGGYWKIWIWGSQHLEMKADYERQLSRARDDADKWQSIALRTTGLAEHGVVLAKQRIEGRE